MDFNLQKTIDMSLLIVYSTIYLQLRTSNIAKTRFVIKSNFDFSTTFLSLRAKMSDCLQGGSYFAEVGN